MKRLFAVALVAGCAHAHVNETRSLESAVRQRIAQVDSGTIAVSYIDLAHPNREFHINGDVVMHAASTMKVPVLIELYHQAEQHKLSIDSPLVVRNVFQSIADTSHYTLDAGDDSDSSLYKQVGQRVPIRELARLMIVRSSNLATNNLIDLVGPANVRGTVDRIGATGMNVQRGVQDIPAFNKGLNNTTTSKGLAYSLLAIAQCRTLTRTSCDEMLQTLSAQEFNEMIPSGLPAGTRVAHKTGSITGISHDGAIVYPKNGAPYVLVILTHNVKDPAKVGGDISRLVWERR